MQQCLAIFSHSILTKCRSIISFSVDCNFIQVYPLLVHSYMCTCFTCLSKWGICSHCYCPLIQWVFVFVYKTTNTYAVSPLFQQRGLTPHCSALHSIDLVSLRMGFSKTDTFYTPKSEWLHH